MVANGLARPDALGLNEVLSTSHHAFLQPSRDIYDTALNEARAYIDPLASAISAAQQEREKQYYAEKKKRKRGEYEDAEAPHDVLRMKRIHVDGFDVEQIWGQAQRVLKAAADECEKDIEKLEQDAELHGDMDATLDGMGSSGEDEEMFSDNVLEDGVESGSDELSDDLLEDVEEEDEAEEVDDLEDEDVSEDDEEDRAMYGIDEDEDGEAGEADGAGGNAYEEDPNGLNDGFFSIEDFNRNSAFLERQDARADPDDGAASDEEEVDWAADPLSQPLPKQIKGDGSDAEDDEDAEGDEGSEEGEDDDSETGPTFGNVDLYAPEGASEDEDEVEQDEMEGMDDLSNTNNIMYSDFFAPPPKKSKNKRGRPHPHNFPAKDPKNQGTAKASLQGEEDDVKRAMSAVHRDLFSDSDEASDASDAEALDPADPVSRRSVHERRQAQILTEIRKLEAENVTKRSWQLSGEAKAAARPMNSLLEEDLDFERAGKPVPVITAETTEEIEALIKRRILAAEFDEVIRRRPEDMMGPSVRRGRLENVDQTKDKKGLGELYEEEHLRNTDPNFVDAKDESLKKQHTEIQTLWKDVSSKLDSLSSWHYRPKAPEPQIEVRVDAPTISMEDARPSGEVGASMLAPQEVYKAGEAANNAKDFEEVATRGGMPIVKSEMSREEKKRRRMREKERAKKAGANPVVNGKVKARKEKEGQMLGSLKQAGVKVIGKKGELRDVSGKAVAEDAPRPNPSGWKL
ncbi:Mpp10 protein [Eremomyces bilateralis CBS 781.70]|uniref:U3 small nucleolar ribonucleoprotein protein MPP10 n=1 Tax=Eremomyces bilateralis CBS 781.70 TaxID=1392243 RepID=A0A6G1G9P0_9PEZI|nr:Mpp10 protein [Eremomyces bilateralis CBS 781.70]KAF1814656.1 Mpp10 protein [Eremomyces bilateralis CBS 781.70]